eukprot:TRINITY_DN66451_c0_g1_i1.p1 TRINITY_DN66451_c0_g1~~TRINITY_DN66451_c0_g1_i1.p1  ORF type:complete len:252 (-),score=50.76 TRINITY_DN66451_c0_g1_i1:24-779(-)
MCIRDSINAEYMGFSLEKLREGSFEEDKKLNIEGLGEFISYKNKCVKCTFKDRTIVRYKERDPMAIILTNSGERLEVSLESPIGFERYLEVCMEFVDFSFTPTRVREEQAEQKWIQQALIEGQMEQISRTISIMNNKIPTSSMPSTGLSDPGATFVQPPEEETMEKKIEKLLKQNERSIGAIRNILQKQKKIFIIHIFNCLLYTSDAADDTPCVDLGGRRIIKKKKSIKNEGTSEASRKGTCTRTGTGAAV